MVGPHTLCRPVELVLRVRSQPHAGCELSPGGGPGSAVLPGVCRCRPRGSTAASGRASESSWSPQRWRSWSVWLLFGPEAALPAQEAGWLPFPCIPGQWPPKCSQSGLCSGSWHDMQGPSPRGARRGPSSLVLPSGGIPRAPAP